MGKLAIIAVALSGLAVGHAMAASSSAGGNTLSQVQSSTTTPPTASAAASVSTMATGATQNRMITIMQTITPNGNGNGFNVNSVTSSSITGSTP